MKIYLVGGAVRDKLLGLPVKEKDWVVVGATVNDMLNENYRQVGKEFPVFLHPKTNEEYALARMERKVNPGYKGFTFDTSPTVTLEDDLIRRDLTINAMAEDDGKLIDPYHGKQDLEAKILRHVSPAFSEDPVRILRVGRFFARYAYLGFHIAPETITLMQHMVKAGEVDALVAERVWKELERALGEKNPEKFFEVLDNCGALPVLFPQIPITGPGMNALLAAANITDSPIVRFAALLHALPEPKKDIATLCNRYRIPNAYRELATLTGLHYEKALQAQTLTDTELLQLFSSLDIYRREERFKDFINACTAIANVHGTHFDSDWLIECSEAAKAAKLDELFDTFISFSNASQQIKDSLNQPLSGPEKAAEIKKRRLKKIQDWLKNQK